MPQTFCTTCGEPAPCPQLKPAGWMALSRLLGIGALFIGISVYLTALFMMTRMPALPPTPSAGVSTLAFPPTATVTTSPSPSPNPLIPPTYQVVVVTTLTPVPTPTMTTFQQQSTAVVQTQVASLNPRACPETTVTPGESRVCYWETQTPTPIAPPEYKTCETPVPGAYCLKEDRRDGR